MVIWLVITPLHLRSGWFVTTTRYDAVLPLTTLAEADIPTKGGRICTSLEGPEIVKALQENVGLTKL
jgi:hypothetical protein